MPSLTCDAAASPFVVLSVCVHIHVEIAPKRQARKLMCCVETCICIYSTAHEQLAGPHVSTRK